MHRVFAWRICPTQVVIPQVAFPWRLLLGDEWQLNRVSLFTETPPNKSGRDLRERVS